MSSMAPGTAIDPELVFATIRPVGTPDDKLMTALKGGLLSYGYRCLDIKLSTILSDHAIERGEPIPARPEHDRINLLMNEGDLLCRQRQDAAAVVQEGIRQLRAFRQDVMSNGRPVDVTERAAEALPRTAYIFDSLKRPAEVQQLRDIYGDRLLVISLQASIATRRSELGGLIKPHASGPESEVRRIVDGLIERDLAESDDDFDQHLQRTFPMADAFIDVDECVESQLQRVLNRVFGSPEYDLPTSAEYGMHLAHVSQTRSPELGLKVGAAVVTDEFAVLSLGANTHPVPSGTPAYDASMLDIHELVLDTLNRLGREALSDAARSRLDAGGRQYVAELLGGALRRARVRDLTEFQPTVHAEMNALLDALRRGVSLERATMYVTAYPCHNCAKHLLAIGLPVRYIEPYPKSRAQAMFGDTVTASFLPFTGIAPRRYEALFVEDADRKNPDGTRKPWGSEEKHAAQPRVEAKIDQRGIADREDAAITPPEDLMASSEGQYGNINVTPSAVEGAVLESGSENGDDDHPAWEMGTA